MDKRKFLCKGVLQKCFPPGFGEKAVKLEDIFTAKFCDHLTCFGDKFPSNFLPESKETNQTTQIIYYIAISLLGIGIGFWYLIMLIIQSEKPSNAADLRTRRRSKFCPKWFNNKFKGKKKTRQRRKKKNPLKEKIFSKVV